LVCEVTATCSELSIIVLHMNNALVKVKSCRLLMLCNGMEEQMGV